ncbi:MAG: deoxyribose-phosphate aldolase, partial [Pedosphaera sp.]|nr:deoxyribose-phosphate aldolase [Pedosphaera sp.]
AEHQFSTVCVNGSRVELAYSLLDASDVQVCTVVGFPLGAMDADAKRYETEVAVDLGASEIDMVMNVGRFKDGEHDYIVREIRDVVEAADDRVVKVILETCLLTNDEIAQACKLVTQAQAHFVKTSTGFGNAGATLEHVRLMRETVGQFAGVKAAGGVRNANDAQAMIEAGATRIGTSNGVAIVSGESANGSY